MTVKQALIATISLPWVDENTLEKALIDNDLNPSTEYSKAQKGKVEVAAIGVLFGELQKQSIGEGDFSVSLNYDAAKLNLVRLAQANPSEPISQQVLSIYGERNAVNSVSRW